MVTCLVSQAAYLRFFGPLLLLLQVPFQIKAVCSPKTDGTIGWNCYCPEGEEYEQCTALRTRRMFHVDQKVTVGGDKILYNEASGKDGILDPIELQFFDIAFLINDGEADQAEEPSNKVESCVLNMLGPLIDGDGDNNITREEFSNGLFHGTKAMPESFMVEPSSTTPSYKEFYRTTVNLDMSNCSNTSEARSLLVQVMDLDALYSDYLDKYRNGQALQEPMPVFENATFTRTRQERWRDALLVGRLLNALNPESDIDYSSMSGDEDLTKTEYYGRYLGYKPVERITFAEAGMNATSRRRLNTLEQVTQMKWPSKDEWKEIEGRGIDSRGFFEFAKVIYPSSVYSHFENKGSDKSKYPRTGHRILTGIKKQQGGTCWAYSSTAAMESAIAREVHIKSAVYCQGLCTDSQITNMPRNFRKLRDKVMDMVSIGGEKFAITDPQKDYTWKEWPQKDLFYTMPLGDLMHTTNWEDQAGFYRTWQEHRIATKGVSLVRIKKGDITTRGLQRDPELAKALIQCGLDKGKTTFTSKEINECYGATFNGRVWASMRSTQLDSSAAETKLASSSYSLLALIFYIGVSPKPESRLQGGPYHHPRFGNISFKFNRDEHNFISKDLYKDLLPDLNLHLEFPRKLEETGSMWSLSSMWLKRLNVKTVEDSDARAEYDALAGDSSSSAPSSSNAQDDQAEQQVPGPAKIYSNSFLCLLEHSLYYQILVGEPFDFTWWSHHEKLSLNVVQDIKLRRTMTRPEDQDIIPMPEAVKQYLIANQLHPPILDGESSLKNRLDQLQIEVGYQLTLPNVGNQILKGSIPEKERSFWDIDAPLLQENGAHLSNGSYYEFPLSIAGFPQDTGAQTSFETSCLRPNPGVNEYVAPNVYVPVEKRYYFRVTKAFKGAGGTTTTVSFHYLGEDCHLDMTREPPGCEPFALPLFSSSGKRARKIGIKPYSIVEAVQQSDSGESADGQKADLYLWHKLMACHRGTKRASTCYVDKVIRQEVNTELDNFGQTAEQVDQNGDSKTISSSLIKETDKKGKQFKLKENDIVYVKQTTNYEPWPAQKMAQHGLSEWQLVLCGGKENETGTTCVITKDERERKERGEETICKHDELGGAGGDPYYAYEIWTRSNGVLFHWDWIMSRSRGHNWNSKVKYYDAQKGSDGKPVYPFYPMGMLYETCSDHGLSQEKGPQSRETWPQPYALANPVPKLRWYYEWKLRSKCGFEWGTLIEQQQGGLKSEMELIRGIQNGQHYLTCVDSSDVLFKLMHKALWRFGELSVPVVWINEMGPFGSKLFTGLVKEKKVVTEAAFLKLDSDFLDTQSGQTIREQRYRPNVHIALKNEEIVAWAPATLGLVWHRFSVEGTACFESDEQPLDLADPVKDMIKAQFSSPELSCHLPGNQSKDPSEMPVSFQTAQKSRALPFDVQFYLQGIQKPIFEQRAKKLKAYSPGQGLVHLISFFKEIMPENRVCCYQAAQIAEKLPGHNHQVTIVGYVPKTDKQVAYWIMRNSHGQNWGDNGFAYIEAKKNMFGLEEEFSAFDANLDDLDLMI